MEERIPSDAGTQATLTIDNRQVTVPTGSTILEAAAELGIRIPTLCWLGKVSTTGACRICIVEIEGVDLPMTACNTPVKDGIKVTTSSPGIEKLRRETMELLLVNHPPRLPGMRRRWRMRTSERMLRTPGKQQPPSPQNLKTYRSIMTGR